MKAGLAEGQKSSRSCYQWVKDFKLVVWEPQGLFQEYLEMGKSVMASFRGINGKVCDFMLRNVYMTVHFWSGHKLLTHFAVKHTARNPC